MSTRDLLAAATPRPWKWHNYSTGKRMFLDATGSFTKHVLKITWPELLSDGDAKLIVAAVNEYEALLDIEAYVRASGISFHLGTSSEVAVGDALARLDVVRSAAC